MLLTTKLDSFNAKFIAKCSLFTVACLCFGILSYSSIAKATDFNGPTELSTQEFKDLNINGPATLRAIKTGSLTVHGPLNFTQITIKGKTEISGPCSGVDGDFADVVVHGTFDGTKVKTNDLHVDGPVTLEDFKITGNVNINGPLKAKLGSFKDINTVALPVQLYDITVNNIYVKKDQDRDGNSNTTNNSEGKNEIKLAGKTIVSGNITFESGDGVVYIRDKTAQLKGKVIGGKIRE